MKKFVKRIEDFVCQFCGKKVKGNGYTDHCPNCLLSVHVDVNPGDRASDCGGKMVPVEFWQKGGKWRILYRCQKCGWQKWNDAAKEDNLEKLTQPLLKP